MPYSRTSYWVVATLVFARGVSADTADRDRASRVRGAVPFAERGLDPFFACDRRIEDEDGSQYAEMKFERLVKRPLRTSV